MGGFEVASQAPRVPPAEPGPDPGGTPPRFLTDSRKRTRLRDVATTLDFQQMLRGVALRVTRPRVAVLSAVHTYPHADTDSIIGAVRRELPDVSHQAVYDSLHALTAAGLLRRIKPSGSVARYEARVGDNHHHVVCRSCGVIADVDCAVGEAPCLTASDDHGFSIEEAEVIYWGLCPDCSSDRSS
jgi:Fur family transcriptional regulator, stress-responsive regulator